MKKKNKKKREENLYKTIEWYLWIMKIEYKNIKINKKK
jgi:hypothetical protein